VLEAILRLYEHCRRRGETWAPRAAAGGPSPWRRPRRSVANTVEVTQTLTVISRTRLRMRVGLAIIATLLVTALVLSGCSGGGGGEASVSATGGVTGTKVTTSKPGSGGGTGTGTGGSGGGTGGGSGGGGGGVGENQAPVGSISASIAQGTVPVWVNFTLTGSDPDGDKLTWNLDLDGDDKVDKSGEALPATVSHNYTAAGTFNVTYTVSDDKHASTSYAITINATAAAGGTGPIQVVDGSYQSGAGAGCSPFGGFLNAVNVDHARFNADPLTWGRPFKITWTTNGPAVEFLIWWLGPDGLEERMASSSPTVEDVVPLDRTSAIVSSCGGGVLITFHYEA
jgi:hypothetical protein